MSLANWVPSQFSLAMTKRGDIYLEVDLDLFVDIWCLRPQT